MHDAEAAIEVAVAQGQSSVTAGSYEVEIVLGRVVCIEEHNLVAGQESTLNAQIPQIECVADDLTNFGVKLGTFFLESAYVLDYFLYGLACFLFFSDKSLQAPFLQAEQHP